MANGSGNRTKNRKCNSKGGSHAHRGTPPGKPQFNRESDNSDRKQARGG